MKKFILAAALFAPLAIAAPALATEATLAGTAGAYVQASPETAGAMPVQYRSRPGMGWSDRGTIDRDAVPSSAFNSGA